MFIKWVGHEILVPHLHIPSAEPGFARSWTACALKLSLLTTAWKFSSPLLAKVRSNLFGKQTTRWSGWHPFTKTKPPACVLIQVEATRSPDQGELQRYQRADPGCEEAALCPRTWTDAQLRLQSSTHRAQQKWFYLRSCWEQVWSFILFPARGEASGVPQWRGMASHRPAW